MKQRALILLVCALGTAACGSQLPSASSPSKPNADQAGGYRVILAESFSSTASHIVVRDAATGKLEHRYLDGTPAPDWSRYYFVTQTTTTAELTAINPSTGKTLAHTALGSGFSLPMFEPGVSAGLSPNGQWIVLSRPAPMVAGTDFAVGASSLAQPFNQVHLGGQYDFDAISNDGRSLYLIQRVDDKGNYRVRLYDVAAKQLQPQVVADKREPNEPMVGVRGDSTAVPDGSFVFTVYARDPAPFIHALPLNQPFAWCVDLPSAAGDMEQQFHWSLVVSREGSRLYAVNGMAGIVSELSATAQTAPPAVVRTRHFDPTGASSLLQGLVVNAEAKEAPLGGAALSADGRTLFAVAQSGIVAIDTGTLQVRGRYLSGQTIPSIRMSTDGKWLYAVSASAGVVWQLDPASGAVAHELHGLNNPWAVLWVEHT